MKILLIFITIVHLFSMNNVKVTVDKKKINEGDSITLLISCNNLDIEPNVDLSNLNDFKIISGPNTSSSTNVKFINGKMERNSLIEYSWILIPQKTGTLTIPSFEINIGKQIIKSEVINIHVNKRNSSISGNLSKFFIEATLNKETVFRGEQIILTYTLYTIDDITSISEELPKFKGFWTEELFSPKKLNPKQVQKNGRKYTSAVLKKIALFPTKSGSITINPLVAVVGIREKQQRWNDFSFFGPPAKQYTISTNSIELTVKPLPVLKGNQINSLVGDWDIVSLVSSNDIIQDEAITYTIKVKGRGNLNAVDFSNISFPNELEAFEPKITLENNKIQNKIGGEKQYEWILIPRFAGNIIIPQYDFNYFNPKLGKWVKKETKVHSLNVLPNEKSNISILGLSKEEVVLMNQDIRFINEGEPHWRNNKYKVFTNTALSFLIMSSFLFLVPYVKNSAIEKLQNFSYNSNSKNAIKYSKKILNSSNNTSNEIYLNIYKALTLFISYKFHIKNIEYSNSKIVDIINRKVNYDVSKKVNNILVRGDAERFSPQMSDTAFDDLADMKLLLDEIDKQWK